MEKLRRLSIKDAEQQRRQHGYRYQPAHKTLLKPPTVSLVRTESSTAHFGGRAKNKFHSPLWKGEGDEHQGAEQQRRHGYEDDRIRAGVSTKPTDHIEGGEDGDNNESLCTMIDFLDIPNNTAAPTRADCSRTEAGHKTPNSKDIKATFEGLAQRVKHTLDQMETLDSYVTTLSSGPHWKQVLVELMEVLEQSGDRLPLPVLNKKRVIEGLLDGDELPLLGRQGPARTAKRYHKFQKLDAEGNLYWAVRAKGEKTEWGSFEIESDADEAIQRLYSPVASLSDVLGPDPNSCR